MTLPIALLGHGKMGHMVETFAPQFGCEVRAILDPADGNFEITGEALRDAQVCIDFTTPAAVLDNARKVAAAGRCLVIGTTGWETVRAEVATLGQEIGIVWGANFSVGVNLFYRIVAEAARLMNAFPEYDPFGLEMHHNRKADSPSGTAKRLAEIVTQELDRKQTPQYDRINRKIEAGEFHLASVRAGNIPGTHLIGFDSPSDTIELKHTVRNREGFAIGALKAAGWIAGRRGFYAFDEIFDDLLAGTGAHR